MVPHSRRDVTGSVYRNAALESQTTAGLFGTLGSIRWLLNKIRAPVADQVHIGGVAGRRRVLLGGAKKPHPYPAEGHSCVRNNQAVLRVAWRLTVVLAVGSRF